MPKMDKDLPAGQYSQSVIDRAKRARDPEKVLREEEEKRSAILRRELRKAKRSDS